MKDNPILVPLKIQHFSEFQIWELSMGFAVEVAVCYWLIASESSVSQLALLSA